MSVETKERPRRVARRKTKALPLPEANQCTKTAFYENGEKRTVAIELCDKWFEEDSLVYNHELGRFCAKFSFLGYHMPLSDSSDESEDKEKNVGVTDALELLGMTDIQFEAQTDIDQINYFIAKKVITVGEDEFTLVFAGFIGSHLGQWYTNFDSGTGKIHKGFNNAKNYAYDKLRNYLESLAADRKKIKLLLTGHSRGAATANLLAAQLINEEIYALEENIFAYTFATPSAVKLAERDLPKYKRIFNILNSEDFVTKCMPTYWGYGRYGTSLSFPKKKGTKKSKELLANVGDIFFGLYGKRYAPFKNGDKAVMKLLASMEKNLDSVEDFYYKPFRSQGEMLSVQEYYSRTLCAIVGELPGSEKSDAASKYMLNTFVGRYTSSPILKAVADFFIVYEGLASATTGKISDTYFTYSHLATTYCSFMMAISGDELINDDEKSQENIA